MAIATHTSRVHNTIGEDGGHLIIDYTVEVDNSLMGEHHFEMTVSTNRTFRSFNKVKIRDFRYRSVHMNAYEIARAEATRVVEAAYRKAVAAGRAA